MIKLRVYDVETDSIYLVSGKFLPIVEGEPRIIKVINFSMEDDNAKTSAREGNSRKKV